MANMESLACSMANEELPAGFVLITLGHHTAFAATQLIHTAVVAWHITVLSFGRPFRWVNRATVTSLIVNDAFYLLYSHVSLRR